MASLTHQLENKRRAKKHRQGHKRKAKLAKRSTLSYAELFAKMGEPKKS
jgi:hypothetical protein